MRYMRATWKARRTCVDLIDDPLRGLFVEIVHYDVRAA